MTAAFVFYLYCSLKNRIRTRVQRLRQPRYLISLVAGLLYLYLVFFRQFLSRDGMRVLRNPSARAEPDLLPLMETGIALLLFGIVLLPWIFPRRNPGISFTEAEIQFLFPAPITRRALLHFRLVKSQLAILFGVLISFLIFGRGRSFSHPFYFLVDLWMVYSFLAFYRMGTALVQTSLAEHGATGIRRHLWVLVLVAGAVFSVFVWLRWFVPSLPPRKGLTPESIVAWISELARSGPAFYILLPFRALVRPALAPEPVSFLLSLIPALLLVLLCYAWVLRSDVSFEEASLERAERMARRIEAARKGGPLLFAAARVRRPPFDLAPGYFLELVVGQCVAQFDLAVLHRSREETKDAHPERLTSLHAFAQLTREPFLQALAPGGHYNRPSPYVVRIPIEERVLVVPFDFQCFLVSKGVHLMGWRFITRLIHCDLCVEFSRTPTAR